MKELPKSVPSANTSPRYEAGAPPSCARHLAAAFFDDDQEQPEDEDLFVVQTVPIQHPVLSGSETSGSHKWPAPDDGSEGVPAKKVQISNYSLVTRIDQGKVTTYLRGIILPVQIGRASCRERVCAIV